MPACSALDPGPGSHDACAAGQGSWSGSRAIHPVTHPPPGAMAATATPLGQRPRRASQTLPRLLRRQPRVPALPLLLPSDLVPALGFPDGGLVPELVARPSPIQLPLRPPGVPCAGPRRRCLPPDRALPTRTDSERPGRARPASMSLPSSEGNRRRAGTPCNASGDRGAENSATSGPVVRAPRLNCAWLRRATSFLAAPPAGSAAGRPDAIRGSRRGSLSPGPGPWRARLSFPLPGERKRPATAGSPP